VGIKSFLLIAAVSLWGAVTYALLREGFRTAMGATWSVGLAVFPWANFVLLSPTYGWDVFVTGFEGLVVLIFMGFWAFATRALSPWLSVALVLAAISAYVAIFSQMDWVLSNHDSKCFAWSLDPGHDYKLNKVGAVYFVVVTFSTVGFGDIVPASDPCRLMVIAQIATGFLIVAFIVAMTIGRLTATRPGD
jgi:hypothetical protein